MRLQQRLLRGGRAGTRSSSPGIMTRFCSHLPDSRPEELLHINQTMQRPPLTRLQRLFAAKGARHLQQPGLARLG